MLSPSQAWAVAGLGAALILLFLCAAVGAAAADHDGAPAVGFPVGYALLSTGVLAAAMLPWPVPLSTAAGVVAAAGIVLLVVVRPQRRELGLLARCGAVALPLMLVAAALNPAIWDELSHWVPSAAHPYRLGRF